MHCNSLFGYQFGVGLLDEDLFAICWCSEDIDHLDVIRDESGAASLTLVDWIGYSALTIHHRDYDKIYEIFNAILRNGQWFRTNNHARVAFNRKRGHLAFTDELMELHYVERVEKDVLSVPEIVLTLKQDPDAFLTSRAYDIWNYRTPQGKALCHRLRRIAGMPEADESSKKNYWNWKLFQDETAT